VSDKSDDRGRAPDLYSTVFFCASCETPSWAREWTVLDPSHALVELAPECRHVALTHIVDVRDLRYNGQADSAWMVPVPDTKHPDRAVCMAMTRHGTRCKNSAVDRGLCGVHDEMWCQWQAGEVDKPPTLFDGAVVA